MKEFDFTVKDELGIIPNRNLFKNWIDELSVSPGLVLGLWNRVRETEVSKL